ncbi:alpha/beta fold hydrolase [Pokkaliibacter sp. MBI-7]|uniref:RBBP9/YdeN family alpha/beta hydrolase n=1 Tax=Pokkaliibacter sp. MBI-7 TaxID=3040600 RepID=UPI00244C908A|nr:alpha/beta fold hydrolase [Pokkaliibacter sp. MBI-7]MDH2436560.1 alpha/beta fold hydrolase [Pokkaliibacter sp. MBI-7]
MHHPVLIHPGFGNSDEPHWQSRWQQLFPYWQRVEQDDWLHPDCNQWVARLDETLAIMGEDTVVVAHSLGCLTLAHWASQSKHRIRAALLVAVPDPAMPAYPPSAKGFTPLPAAVLPFPSLVVTSLNDPYGSPEFAHQQALAWGSGLVEVGALGHINGESGLGDWQEGIDLLENLLQRQQIDTSFAG